MCVRRERKRERGKGSESMNEQADCKLGVWDGWAGRCLWRRGLTVVHRPELDPLSDRGKHVTPHSGKSWVVGLVWVQQMDWTGRPLRKEHPKKSDGKLETERKR